ncbi:MAG: energy transducer TonB, partial [Bacteroidetes bacterium]|nr:energy transducer TonB [Bacteroidota bacterium]
MKKHILLFLLFSLLAGFYFAQDGFNVQVLPSNVGGKAEFKRVFEQELIYPEKALKNNIGGKVLVNFDIKKDSSISNVKLITSGVAELDAEALRLFNLLLWVPAVREGQFIGTGWTVEFLFDPSKYVKICKKRGFTKFNYLKDEKLDSTSTIYKKGVQMPIYTKGNFALQDFIKENLEYPRQAQLS